MIERSRQRSAMLIGQVEVVQRLGDVEVAVSVEATGELVAVVFEVAFDLELGLEFVAIALAPLQPPAELLVPRLLA